MTCKSIQRGLSTGIVGSIVNKVATYITQRRLLSGNLVFEARVPAERLCTPQDFNYELDSTIILFAWFVPYVATPNFAALLNLYARLSGHW